MGNTGSCVGRSASAPKNKGGAPSTPHGIPLPPGKPVAKEITETTISIEWDKPASDGGSEIFAYIVKMSRADVSVWKKLDADCAECAYVAKDLDSGERYKFFVQCENDNGVSKPSEISEVFVTKTREVVANDVNENVKDTFGSSADKYVKKDDENDDKEEDTKSEKSHGSGKSDHSEKSDRSKKSSDSKSSKSSKKSEGEIKFIDEDDRDSDKSSQDASATKENAEKTENVAKGVSNEKEFSAQADDDVGHGKPLGPSAYTYSNDSLLDEDDGPETQHRFNDNAFPVEPVKVHSSFTSTMEEYHTIDNEIPDEHRDLIMNLNYDPEYNRLSIISERSVEDSIGTPDPTSSPTKDGNHFTFIKKYNESMINAEVCGDTKKELEEVKTMITGKEKSTIVINKSQTECKPMETRIPMMGAKREIYNQNTSSVSKEVTTSVKEVKVQSKIPTTYKSDDKKAEMERKSSIPEPERKSSIPEMERKSSIPKLGSKDKPKSDKNSPSQIPRRDSAGKIIPTRSDSIEEGKPSSGIPQPSSRSESPSSKPTSGIPTVGGVNRRGSRDSPKTNGSPQHTQSRIPSPGLKSGIPPPRVNTS